MKVAAAAAKRAIPVGLARCTNTPSGHLFMFYSLLIFFFFSSSLIISSFFLHVSHCICPRKNFHFVAPQSLVHAYKYTFCSARRKPFLVPSFFFNQVWKCFKSFTVEKLICNLFMKKSTYLDFMRIDGNESWYWHAFSFCF